VAWLLIALLSGGSELLAAPPPDQAAASTAAAPAVGDDGGWPRADAVGSGTATMYHPQIVVLARLDKSALRPKQADGV
jgi:hypothetical protein